MAEHDRPEGNPSNLVYGNFGGDVDPEPKDKNRIPPITTVKVTGEKSATIRVGSVQPTGRERVRVAAIRRGGEPATSLPVTPEPVTRDSGETKPSDPATPHLPRHRLRNPRP